MTSLGLKFNINSKLIRMANPHVGETLIVNDIILLPFSPKEELL